MTMPNRAMISGYTNCACRDCMDLTVSSDTDHPEMCGLCLEAGCDPVQGECQRSDAYVGQEEES